MLLSLRKSVAIVIMVLALLAGLLGWSMHLVSMPAMYHHSSIHSIHALADGGPNYYCPPPPRSC